MQVESPCLYCRYKQRSDPATALVWSYAQSSVIRSTSPQQRHQQQQQRLATVYTMGFSEAQLSAHPSLVMFCKENKFQMAIVSWRSQTDSEQRHGAAVHFSSCVATCRPRVTCRPTWPRLHMSAPTTRIQVTDSVHYVYLLRWSPLQPPGQSPRYLDARYVIKFLLSY